MTFHHVKKQQSSSLLEPFLKTKKQFAHKYLEWWPNFPYYLKHKVLAKNIGDPQNSASSKRKGTVAPKLDTSPEGKVSSPWQAGKYPNRFHGFRQGNVSQLKCLSLQKSLLKFYMTFSMLQAPPGDLVVCRAHELGEQLRKPSSTCTWVPHWNFPRHRDLGTCSFHSWWRESVSPKISEGIPVTDQPCSHMSMCPESRTKQRSLSHFTKPRVFMTLFSRFSVINQKAKHWAWKQLILTQFPTWSKVGPRISPHRTGLFQFTYELKPSIQPRHHAASYSQRKESEKKPKQQQWKP